MSRVSKMSLNDIFSHTNLIMRERDIIYFCTNMDVIKEFFEKCRGTNYKIDEIKQSLLAYEEFIDKEKLILLMVKNYQDNLDLIDKRIKFLKNKLAKSNSKEDFSELALLNAQVKEQKEKLAECIRLGEGIEAFITFYYYDEENKKYKIEVVDSREAISGKKVSKTKNLKRFDEIDSYFKKGGKDSGIGWEYVLQSIKLSDLCSVFPDVQFGNDIRTMILENEILKKGKQTEELQKLKGFENNEKYTELINNAESVETLPNTKETLREYVAYLDIDKLLLVCAYRFHEALESLTIETRVLISIKEILQGIEKKLKPNAQISCYLQDKTNQSLEFIDVSYSTSDLRQCLKQFVGSEYLKKREINEYKRKVQMQEINLLQLPVEYLDVIFSQEELEELTLINENNLMCVLTIYNWDNEKIIETLNKAGNCSTKLLSQLVTEKKLNCDEIIKLYEQSVISLDSIKCIKSEIDLSGNISFGTLNSFYEQSKQHPEDTQLIDKYKRYVKLYKEVFITDNSQEKIGEESNKLMEQIIENYEEQEYVEAVKNYYNEGLLTLEAIAEWNNEEFITNLYQDGTITLKDIEGLVLKQKLSFDYLSNKYRELVFNNDIDYNERLKYIRTGYVKEEDILDLYKRNLLFESDLLQLTENSIVRQDVVKRLIEGRTKEELEQNSSIKLIGLNNLNKKNNSIYAESTTNSEYNVKDSKTPKSIIDPNEREEFISLFKARRATTDLWPDSPFYDYEFYVIPDESGDIGLNSVVIAERYYEDKETEAKFALNNATYFFKYKDLMVLSNLKKSEMTKERSNIVFTANHTMATEERTGYWAASVMKNIARTMLSSDLKEYNKRNQRAIILERLKRVYSAEEIINIFEKAAEIDSGEHICEIVEPVKENAKRNNSSSKKNKYTSSNSKSTSPNFDDDDSGVR